jgi:hypothetical protein
MEAAIAHLNLQKSLNYAEAARTTIRVDPSALARRHKGLTVTRAEATSTFHQRLNNIQEDTLLGYIYFLTDRRITSTTPIIKNLAEEIINRPVGKN